MQRDFKRLHAVQTLHFLGGNLAKSAAFVVIMTTNDSYLIAGKMLGAVIAMLLTRLQHFSKEME